MTSVTTDGAQDGTDPDRPGTPDAAPGAASEVARDVTPDLAPPALDPVIHAEARLRITASLAAVPVGDAIAFPRLQKLLGMTSGNLSTHLRKLEDAGYVEVTKTFEGRTPATYLALTSGGRAAFDTYTRTLRSLLTP